jgi:hypothetical protein
MANILLVGNGPNYFSKGASWADVVRATARHARLRNQTENIIHEPLPLVYETIAARYPQKEKRARLELAKEMRRLAPNEIHRDLMGLGWATTLTTNYDHCLEQACGESFAPANLAGETTYSVFRRARSKNRSIWHIHGDLGGPRTMMLGMHHYCGYLQKLRAYLTTKAEKSPFVFGDHSQPIESGRHSWADLFLRDDVHIVGLGLSYAEVGLWWLLGYKFRLRHQKKLPCGSTTYYVMGVGDPSEKHRLELMMAYGVKIEIVKGTAGPPSKKTWSDLVHLLKSVRTS